MDYFWVEVEGGGVSLDCLGMFTRSECISVAIFILIKSKLFCIFIILKCTNLNLGNTMLYIRHDFRTLTARTRLDTL